MDKRTVTALGIIGLIFVLLPFYWEWIGFSKKPVPPAESQLAEPGSDSLAAYSDSEFAGDSGALSGAPAATTSRPGAPAFDTLPEQFATIETDLFTARLTSRGAGIASFKLKRFEYLDGTGPVDLVPQRLSYPLQFSVPEAGSLNFQEVSFTPSVAEVSLSERTSDSASVSFSGVTPGGAPVRVEYTFRRSSYLVGLRVHLGQEGEFSRATRLDLGWKGGLDPTEHNRSDDYGYFSGYVRQGAEVAKFDSFDDGKLREGSTGSIEWVGTKSKYFLVALIRTDATAEEFEVTATESKVVEAGQQVARREFNIQLGNRIQGGQDPRFELYLGPVDYHVLGHVGHDLDRAVDMGFWLFKPFAVAILWFITFLHKIIPSYGWSIVIFTVVMKVILFPFSRKNYQQMHRMKALQPKLKEIQEKHKEDPQELNRRMMKLYKEEKFNPLGGCMWMLPQLPIFWALFTVFKSYIELRGEGFLWLTDLSQASLLLCGFMSAAMLGQQLLTNKDPKQKFLVYGMPILMFFFFKGLPSGLVLYWTVYNLLSIAEQWSVERGLGPAVVTVTEEPPVRKTAKK